ncbi:MAG: family 20 glycosylhydrolase [Clostridia bacterium]|nr:family 20 glycosylhydrolase [Clostridia bacterium]
MFFEPKFFEKNKPVFLNSAAAVDGEGYAKELSKSLVQTFGTEAGSIQNIRFLQTLPEGMTVPAGEETYALVITKTEALLCGTTERARIYAAVTLKQLCEFGELCTGRLEDAPDCAYRGYRAYLPGRKSFQHFYDVVDLLAYYKYNYLSLEVGGAMEYKRHPEINAVWKEYAKDTHRYSGRTKEIQNGYGWCKNSIHTDNGEGDILTQEEVRTLVEYAKSRGLTVYPEVPTLSHCDYLCMAHPEIREREADDQYPDTYCPNHPDTYPLVFDVMEEILDVFQPELVNIGHDEYYSMALCPRCKGKKPHDIFADDVKKIHGWLKERGIRTSMWGEKLLPTVTATGRTYGGAGNAALHWPDQTIYIPETYYCQYLLPRDILMFNWYYSFGLQTDFVYHTHGYEMVFGNISATNVKYWRERRKFGAIGGSFSNWGSYHPEYMQRNNQYYQMISGAFIFWSDTYDDSRRSEVMEKAFHEAFRLHYGDLADGSYVLVTHTTDRKHKYFTFVDGLFIEDEVYHLGRYKLTYTDGTEAFLDVKYGTNISNREIPCSWGGEEIDFNPESTLDASALSEVCYSAIPSMHNGVTYYTTAYENPHPEKKVKSMEYISESDATVDVLKIQY